MKDIIDKIIEKGDIGVVSALKRYECYVDGIGVEAIRARDIGYRGKIINRDGVSVSLSEELSQYAFKSMEAIHQEAIQNEGRHVLEEIRTTLGLPSH